MGSPTAIDDVSQRPGAAPVPYYVRGLVLGVSAYLIGVHLWTWVFMFPAFYGGLADFRRLYTAGYMIRTGYRHELYDYATQYSIDNRLFGHTDIALPYNHLPHETVLFALLSYLSYKQAYLLFLCINILLLAICYRVLGPAMKKLATIYQVLPVALCLSFLPIAATLLQGQDSIMLLVLLTCAWRALQRQREFASGVFIGLGLFKFQIVIPILGLFLVWRRWRFCLGFIAAALPALLVSLWIVGLPALDAYMHSLLSMSVNLASLGDQFRTGITPDIMPNLRGLVFGLTSAKIPVWGVQALTFLLSAGTAVYAFIMGAKLKSSADQFLVCIVTACLVSYHMLIHDMSILFLPIVLTFANQLHAEGPSPSTGRAALRSAALLFVAPLCISYSPQHFYLVSLPIGFFFWAMLTHLRSKSLPCVVADTPAFP